MWNLADRFQRDERGVIAIIFALTLMPLLLVIGISVDYGSASSYGTAMQNELDAAVLDGARELAKTDDVEKAKAMAARRFSTSKAAIGGAKRRFSVDYEERTVKAEATAEYKTPFLGIAGIPYLTVNATSAASAKMPKPNPKLQRQLQARARGSRPEKMPSERELRDVIYRVNQVCRQLRQMGVSGKVPQCQAVFDGSFGRRLQGATGQRGSCRRIAAGRRAAGAVVANGLTQGRSIHVDLPEVTLLRRCFMAVASQSYDVVVCGAGISGIAAAHALAEAGVGRIALIEAGPPLGLTSDKSSECYRNWWPGPGDAMVSYMNRSIDLMEGHARRAGNPFQMNRRGYIFATARPETIGEYERQAAEAAELGSGPLRRWDTGQAGYEPATASGFESTLDGADLLLDPALIREHFSYLHPDTVAVLHTRRCGSLSAQTLGMFLLEEARENGVDLVIADLVGVERTAGRVSGVRISDDGEETALATDTLVLSPGPHLNRMLDMVEVELPVLVEKHVKISLPDPLGAVPRSAPLMIWSDPVDLEWEPELREAFAASEETRYLVETFPTGVHGRPVGAGDQVLMYWTYDCPTSRDPVFPLDWDPNLPEITLRGMAAMIPGVAQYFDPMPKPYVDGGYYTKVPDNRPLIGPLACEGAFVCSAFSGYGIMASCAAGELIAGHVTGRDLPDYAAAFVPGRFADPAYCREIEGWALSGQL